MKNTNTNQSFTSLRIVVLFVIMFFSGAASAQAVSPASNVLASADAPAASSSIEYNTNINMVSWFMGTKQTPKAGPSNDGTSAKKQMINAGIAPNRLLLKVMLKKATDFQIATA